MTQTPAKGCVTNSTTTQEYYMSLIDFCKSLPSDLVLAPIYKKGAEMPSGKIAVGKNPVPAAWNRDLNAADCVRIFEKSKEVGALGIWCGIRGGGIVIVDVDRNLFQLKQKWGKSLDGAPVVTSPRENAAKYIFRVSDESIWGELSGFGHSEQHADGFEILWNKRQGVIYGEYHAGGSYTLQGDLSEIPEAPDWVLAEMRAAKAPSGLIKNRSVLSFDGRSPEQLQTIIEECLSVIPNKGAGSRDEWVNIGMSIHSALPDEKGLELWSKWSAEDVDYADAWADGKNPCVEIWESFKPGGITLGTLIWHADLADPLQKRFSEESRRIVDEAKALAGTNSFLSYDEVIKRGMEAYNCDNVPKMNYMLHRLSVEAGYRDQGELEQLITDHISSADCGTKRTMDDRTPQAREYLIPSLLPKPYTLLVHGREGSGKSASVLSLMKHVVDGIPFQLRGQEVDVQKGPVIYFNSDMSAQDFEEEFDLHEIKNQHLFHEVPDFNIYRKVQFMKIMKEVKPVMICIDSLSSCSGSKSENENKASFAQPIYWINARNGKDWPACAVVILHHTSKSTGEARGSTAIAAAAAEVWRVETPTDDNKLRPDQRLITVGKSRIGRVGERLLQIQNDDLTVGMVEWQKPDAIQTKAGSLSERILQRLLVSNKPMTMRDLCADQITGGSVSAVKKTLTRMVNRGVIKIAETRPRDDGKGKPENYYVPAGRKTSSCGGTQNDVSDKQIPSAGTEVKQDKSRSENEVSRLGETIKGLTGTPAESQEECPIKESSDAKGSDLNDPDTVYPHARQESGAVTDEERQRSINKWDI